RLLDNEGRIYVKRQVVMMGYLKLIAALLPLFSLVASRPLSGNGTIQGFSVDGIAALNDAMHQWVDNCQGAGVVTLLSRNGEIINHDAYGVLDISAVAKKPVQKDSIFAIMSMTKPFVGVAMMM